MLQSRLRFAGIGVLGFAFALTTVACGSSEGPTGTTDEKDSGTVEDTGTVEGEDTGTVEGDAATDTGTAKDSGTVDTGTPPPDTSCVMKTWFKDSDSDGAGDSKTTQMSCAQPSGFVADNTDCDDTKSAINPKAAEICDGLDNNCDGKVDGTAAEAAACTATAGTYTGTYSMYTAEKLGSTIVNQMQCTGTSSITINLAGTPQLKGTVTCAYAGSLGGFDKSQSGTVEGTVKPDGTLDGKLTHKFGSTMTHTMTFKGTLVGTKIDIKGTSSWKPNPMSAVPWEINYAIVANK